MASSNNCGCVSVAVAVPVSECVSVVKAATAAKVVAGGSRASLTDKERISILERENACFKKKIEEMLSRIAVLEKALSGLFTPNTAGDQFIISGITDAAIPRVDLEP